MPNQYIKIKGARVHNLKNINVDIPRNRLVVITGLSGSGKSSLAFDTIYAEGQRRYVESLSTYARQFLGLMDKPDVDKIEGLSPAISIDQRTVSHNPRSTVGTVTEIYDYLRVLYARAGIPHCHQCGRRVEKQTIDSIVERLFKLTQVDKIIILAPIIRDKKGEHKQLIEEAGRAGFTTLRFDGKEYEISEALELKVDRYKRHNLSIVVDKIPLSSSGKSEAVDRQRLVEALETALDLGDGLVIIEELPRGEEHLFSLKFSCPHCEVDLPEIEPRTFSFNSPHGACSTCTGLGTRLEVDPQLVVPNPRLTIAQGAIRPWSRNYASSYWLQENLAEVGRRYGFSLHTPFKELTKRQQDIVFYGQMSRYYQPSQEEGEDEYEGVIPHLLRRYKETESDYLRADIERYMRVLPCPTCRGRRLRPEALAVTVGGLSIAEVVALSIGEAKIFFHNLQRFRKTELVKEPLTKRQLMIARQLLKEISRRLSFLSNVGLDYLTLDRAAATLSGGEAQRIRLATQIGSQLTGVIYILDEPSIGLHQRDNERLIATLKSLRNLGNTVIVVEHDASTILAADYILDIGPGAGKAGGKIVAAGPPTAVKRTKQSLTGNYLAGRLKIKAPKRYRQGTGQYLEILGANEHNLKNINIKIPLGKFICVTGVSGSGKSTLVTDILAKALAQKFHQAKETPGAHRGLKGVENLDKVIVIDQSPIGRTPRSNPATYTSCFTPIRELFAQLPEARLRGFKPGRFSFNVKGGRCEACQGDGLVRIEMHFLPDVYVECDECQGKRYTKEALEIHYKGKNIADVLAMTVNEASEFFVNVPAIYAKLKTLIDVGLGYIKLGQPAPTLSGGEAQRVKLATELSRRATGKTLYILDEPTTGLHFEDIKRLLAVLNKLVDKRNTVLVIEHNLDVIKSADWLIDLGPEGGDKGGKLVAEGTPREVAKVKDSYTGQFLKRVLR